jgi:flagellar motor switch protein FliM
MIKEGVGAEQQKSLPNYLLDAAGISLDRMPMLNVIFDRMAATCTDSLQSMVGTPCYFSVNGINNGRVGDIIKDYEANAVAAVLYAEKWDARVLIMLDRDFVFTMVEALLGSDGAEPRGHRARRHAAHAGEAREQQSGAVLVPDRPA